MGNQSNHIHRNTKQSGERQRLGEGHGELLSVCGVSITQDENAFSNQICTATCTQVKILHKNEDLRERQIYTVFFTTMKNE